MAKQPRKNLSGKEALYLIKQNRINQAWLAEQLGITPQSLTSRFHASEFRLGYQMEINKITGKRIFDVDADVQSVVADANRVPVYDMRTTAGFETIQIDDYMANNVPVAEYVTVQGLKGCVGLYVYGDSMSPEYRAGDIIFIRKEPELDYISWGRPYMIVTRNNGRVLKCIYQSTHDAQCLRLTSYNEDTNRHGDRLYPDYEIKKENVIAIYRVEGMFRREQM